MSTYPYGITEFIQRVKLLPSGCLEWQGCKSRQGYGIFKNGGLAHRYIYEFHYGPIPKHVTGPGRRTLDVHHTCYNTLCVNPDHLELMHPSTHARMPHRTLKTHCVNGHEFTAENTYRPPQVRRRQCKQCKRDNMYRIYWERKRALQ